MMIPFGFADNFISLFSHFLGEKNTNFPKRNGKTISSHTVFVPKHLIEISKVLHTKINIKAIQLEKVYKQKTQEPKIIGRRKRKYK